MDEPQPDVSASVKSAAKRKRAASADGKGDTDEIDYLLLYFEEGIETDDKGREKIVWRCRQCGYPYRPQKAGNTTDKEWWRMSAPGKHWTKHHKNAGNEGSDEANESEEPADGKVPRLMRANCRLRQTNLCLQGEDCRQCWCSGEAKSVTTTFAHRIPASISLAKVVPLNVLASSSTESRTSTPSPSTSDMRNSDNAGTPTSAAATDPKEEKRKEMNKKAAKIRRQRLKHPEDEASAYPKTNAQLLELQRQLVDDTGEGSAEEIESLQRNCAYAKEFHGSLASTLNLYDQVEQRRGAGTVRTHGDIVDFHSERQRLRKMIATLLEETGRMEEALLQIRALLRTVMGVAHWGTTLSNASQQMATSSSTAPAAGTSGTPVLQSSTSSMTFCINPSSRQEAVARLKQGTEGAGSVPNAPSYYGSHAYVGYAERSHAMMPKVSSRMDYQDGLPPETSYDGSAHADVFNPIHAPPVGFYNGYNVQGVQATASEAASLLNLGAGLSHCSSLPQPQPVGQDNGAVEAQANKRKKQTPRTAQRGSPTAAFVAHIGDASGSQSGLYQGSWHGPSASSPFSFPAFNDAFASAFNSNTYPMHPMNPSTSHHARFFTRLASVGGQAHAGTDYQVAVDIRQTMTEWHAIEKELRTYWKSGSSAIDKVSEELKEVTVGSSAGVRTHSTIELPLEKERNHTLAVDEAGLFVKRESYSNAEYEFIEHNLGRLWPMVWLAYTEQDWKCYYALVDYLGSIIDALLLSFDWDAPVHIRKFFGIRVDDTDWMKSAEECSQEEHEEQYWLRANCILRQRKHRLQDNKCRQCWCSGTAELVAEGYTHRSDSKDTAMESDSTSSSGRKIGRPSRLPSLLSQLRDASDETLKSEIAKRIRVLQIHREYVRKERASHKIANTERNRPQLLKRIVQLRKENAQLVADGWRDASGRRKDRSVERSQVKCAADPRRAPCPILLDLPYEVLNDMARCVPSLKRHCVYVRILRAVSLWWGDVHPDNKSMLTVPITTESATRILEEATAEAKSLERDVPKVKDFGRTDGVMEMAKIANDGYIAKKLLTSIAEDDVEAVHCLLWRDECLQSILLAVFANLLRRHLRGRRDNILMLCRSQLMCSVILRRAFFAAIRNETEVVDAFIRLGVPWKTADICGKTLRDYADNDGDWSGFQYSIECLNDQAPQPSEAPSGAEDDDRPTNAQRTRQRERYRAETLSV